MSARVVGLLALAAVALAGLAGCGHRTAPTAPLERLGPAVEEVFPLARAVHVPLVTPIWARFRAPLDTATVLPTNIFLKHDTARIPIALAYDATTRTLTLTPLQSLQLRHTYTIEITPRVATADGVTLDSTYFWQFTTTTVHPLEHPLPADGALGQSPFAALGWDATDAAAGPVRFEVFSGLDSAAVAAHLVTPSVTGNAYRIAIPQWATGSTPWWRVRATNLDTGEQVEGPLWHFTVLAAGAAVDSLVVPVSSFGSVSSSRPTSPGCTSTSFSMGGGNKVAIRWRLESAPPGLRLARAVILIWPISSTARTDGAIVLGTTGDFDGCQMTYTGAPTADVGLGALAPGVLDVATGALIYQGDRLSAHVQCALSVGQPFGYMFMSAYSFSVNSPVGALPPLLRVVYYRDPPGAPAAPATRAKVARGARD